jgi:hypothetical protein
VASSGSHITQTPWARMPALIHRQDARATTSTARGESNPPCGHSPCRQPA